MAVRCRMTKPEGEESGLPYTTPWTPTCVLRSPSVYNVICIQDYTTGLWS